MLNQMDEGLWLLLEHWRVCCGLPQADPLDVIANLNRQLGKAAFKGV